MKVKLNRIFVNKNIMSKDANINVSSNLKLGEREVWERNKIELK